MENEEKLTAEECGTPAEETVETTPENEAPKTKAEAKAEAKKEKKAAKEKAKEEKNAALEELQKVQEEFAAHKQQYLRVLAEYDNFRKRSEREKNASFGNGEAEVIGKILPVADNLERALSQENCTLEQLKEGLNMVNKQFHETLQVLGVKEMGFVGEQFDPNLHNAVMHIDDENYGENEICAVFQKGYMLGDKVIRHAMVQVAN